MNYHWTADLQSKTYQDSLKIRKIVFMEEQHVPLELEIDELEDQTIHVVGYLKDEPVTTARIYETSSDIYKVQRVAVLKEQRGKQYGADLMKEIKRFVLERHGKSLVLDAQDHALHFYEKLGYTITSEGFMDAGIPHHTMTLEL